MDKINLFSGIDSEGCEKIAECFGMKKKIYEEDEIILSYSDNGKSVYIIQSGAAQISCIDEDGNYSLLENLAENDVFGEMFCFPINNVQYIVKATQRTEVCSLDYYKIIRPCANVCEYHCRLLDNFCGIMAEKVQTLSMRISILTQRSVRRKLLTYLQAANSGGGYEEFTIALSLSELADYLNVDRSSLMREIRSMKREEILWSKGRNFRFIEN
ncbi:MAG: Crp/Fnr family transcriptional regulator [Acutalibacteraceae bacterium]